MRRTHLTADHDAFRVAARAFVDRSLRPRHEEIVEARAIPRDLWLEAGRAGFLGLEVPERLGGADAGDYRFNAVLIEELAVLGPAFASAFSVHFDVVGAYLVGLTTEAQRQRWLPRFCTGELVTAIAMTEPTAGSDVAAIRTTARREGDEWVIDGAKTFITNGHNADLVIVAAKTSPEKRAKGITLFAVEDGTPGFRRGRKLDKVGQPEADTAELWFDGVRVPADNLIGELGRGFLHMMSTLAQERVGAAVANVAHALSLFLETLDYVKTRTAFGGSIGSMQANKFRLAELATQLDVTRAFVDNAVVAHAAGELDPADAAKAKWWSAEVQNSVLDQCLQLHGGYGFMNEYRIARAWKDARITKIWAGSNEIMKELVGRSLGL